MKPPFSFTVLIVSGIFSKIRAVSRWFLLRLVFHSVQAVYQWFCRVFDEKTRRGRFFIDLAAGIFAVSISFFLVPYLRIYVVPFLNSGSSGVYQNIEPSLALPTERPEWAVPSSFVASAQDGDFSSCASYPIKGKTTPVLVSGIANSGVFFFDADSAKGHNRPVSLPLETKRACAEKQEEGTFILKGWVFNDNVGWMSLYCPGGGGNNMGSACGDSKYGVTIDSKGNFHGYAWSNVGWIRFSCGESPPYQDTDGCKISNFKVRIAPSVLVSGYATVPPDSYAWSSSVGWMNFAGMKIPVAAEPVLPAPPPSDGSGDIGGGAESSGGSGCTLENCPPYSCPKEFDRDKTFDGKIIGDGLCGSYPEEGYSPPPPFIDCNDTDPFISPFHVEVNEDVCNDKIDNDCNQKIDKEEDSCVGFAEPSPAIPADASYTFNVPYFSGNTSAGSLENGQIGIGGKIRADLRNVIYRNVQQLKRSASTQCNTLGNILSFPSGEKVFYCHGDISIGPIPSWEGHRVLIVENGNVFIRGDIFNENPGQFALFVLRGLDRFTDSRIGNVYISPKVQSLRVQLYADGSLFPAKEDDPDFNGKIRPKKKEGDSGLPDISDDDYGVSDDDSKFFGQLFLQGQFIVRNSLSVAPYLKPVVGKDGKYPKLPDASGDATLTDPVTAKFYSLGFLRAVPKKIGPNCADPQLFNFSDGKNSCAGSFKSILASDNVKASLPDEIKVKGEKEKDEYCKSKSGNKSSGAPVGAPEAAGSSGIPFLDYCRFKEKKLPKKLKEIAGNVYGGTHAVVMLYEPPADDLPGYTATTEFTTSIKGF